jgi:DNA mismatch repair ATPase MutS
MMRSLLVAALLGNCGLFVPCKSAQIPHYDSFFLRTASHDIPTEGKSAFAVEMDDIRVMMRDSSARSLVMIDEIGKSLLLD